MAINTTFPMHCDRGTINGQKVPRDYMVSGAEARELAEFDDALTLQEYRTLQSVVSGGLPVVLVTRERVGSEGKVARMRRTVIIEHALVTPNAKASNRIRVRYSGFEHYVWLQDVVSIKTPDVEYLD
ncbi:hypothetical protein I5H08_gp064 [Mycobacterium phage Yuna]|uniref:Uncharacterized protein n=1 Tax=Mycobacterium phage Yuna TaxID=2599885 RepID=A0A5J6TEY0_9CAUD|nr:hypothetical protein I5H08_gp064 [Mycobacterium phage Yuna]QFG09423.1 hypothetical protein PBI_YUNA_41 [Mycobacterium phage Yuna]